MEYILGIDIGTTSIKVGLLSTTGELKYISTQEYSLITQGKDIIESKIDIYLASCRAGIKEVLDKSQTSPDSILALGFSSQGETLVCLNNKDEVLKNVIVWLDSRAIDEAEIIKKKIPIDKWYKTTGLPEPSPMWPLSKMLWLKRNEPVLYDEVLIIKSIK